MNRVAIRVMPSDGRCTDDANCRAGGSDEPHVERPRRLTSLTRAPHATLAEAATTNMPRGRKEPGARRQSAHGSSSAASSRMPRGCPRNRTPKLDRRIAPNPRPAAQRCRRGRLLPLGCSFAQPDDHGRRIPEIRTVGNRPTGRCSTLESCQRFAGRQSLSPRRPRSRIPRVPSQRRAASLDTARPRPLVASRGVGPLEATSCGALASYVMQ